jgi:hypothetical protein
MADMPVDQDSTTTYTWPIASITSHQAWQMHGSTVPGQWLGQVGGGGLPAAHLSPAAVGAGQGSGRGPCGSCGRCWGWRAGGCCARGPLQRLLALVSTAQLLVVRQQAPTVRPRACGAGRMLARVRRANGRKCGITLASRVHGPGCIAGRLMCSRRQPGARRIDSRPHLCALLQGHACGVHHVAPAPVSRTLHGGRPDHQQARCLGKWRLLQQAEQRPRWRRNSMPSSKGHNAAVTARNARSRVDGQPFSVVRDIASRQPAPPLHVACLHDIATLLLPARSHTGA